MRGFSNANALCHAVLNVAVVFLLVYCKLNTECLGSKIHKTSSLVLYDGCSNFLGGSNKTKMPRGILIFTGKRYASHWALSQP